MPLNAWLKRGQGSIPGIITAGHPFTGPFSSKMKPYADSWFKAVHPPPLPVRNPGLNSLPVQRRWKWRRWLKIRVYRQSWKKLRGNVKIKQRMKTKMIHRLHRLTQIIKIEEIRVNLCNLWTNKTRKEKKKEKNKFFY